jgi:hypothetical protein
MASASDIASFQNRSTGVIVTPIPSLTLPPLPEKISRIDPEGAKAWHQSMTDAVNEWIQSQNAANNNT